MPRRPGEHVILRDDTGGIRFDSVSYSYGSPTGDIEALRDVDVSIAPGELVAVLGRNGSGKSTLALLANGLLTPGSGSVYVDGISTTDEEHVWDVRRRVGVVFQNPDNQIVGTVVEEDVAFGPENLGVPREELRLRVESALETVGLAGLERREPHLLSGGQKQRLAIAGVLALDPAYLVFDEPTAMLDPAGRADVLALIERLRRDGHGIVHITHSLADVASADRAVVLSAGSVVFDGAPLDLLGDPHRLETWGLELPPLDRMLAELRELGVELPSEADEPAYIVGALWP